MIRLLQGLFDPAGLSPHGFCLIWQPGLIWLHALSDAVTALAYYSIPLSVVRFARLRPSISYRWLLYVFAAFILACGTTHLFDIYTLWVPAYWLQGVAKAITAVLSIATALILWPLVPRAAALPSPSDLRDANNELRASQGFLRRTGDVAGIGGWEMDLSTQELSWSEKTFQLYGLPLGHIPSLGESVQYYKPDSRPVFLQAMRECIERGTPFDLSIPMVSAEGREFWARAVGTTEFESEKPMRLVGALQDISRFKQIEQELAEQQELLKLTLEAIGDAVGDAVITTGLSGRILWLNSVAEQLTGWQKSDATGQPVASVFFAINEKTRLPAQNPVIGCFALETGGLRAEGSVLVSRDGIERSVEQSAAPIRDATDAVIGAVLVFRDISERLRLHAEINHRATHDALTGLLNRAEFESRLTCLLSDEGRTGAAHAVMYIDLDQFKVINDACGHSVGDLMLKQASTLLRSSVRAGDTVARLGGDEFGIILEDFALESALLLAQSICKRMEAFRFVHEGQRFQVGTSIGLLQFNEHWRSAGAVLQAVDSCCYDAKEAGRNRVHVWREGEQASSHSKNVQWASRIEQALDENRFELFGQLIQNITPPQCGIQFEVLLRFRNLDGSVCLPGAFIPVAERFHMATRIDRWVVQHVFAWLDAPQTRRDDIAMVSVNISGQSIGDRAFHHQVREMIEAAKFDARMLCFEITETSAITHLSNASLFISEIRRLGVKIALDDFGAGSSSFSHLKALPVDFLKIDGHFIVHLLDDEMDQAAVRCFRDVAKICGLKTIAEYVESENVRAALEAMGIDMIQGYLVHRPEPLASMFPLNNVRTDGAPVCAPPGRLGAQLVVMPE